MAKKKIKDNFGVAVGKFLMGAAASCGAGAIIGCIIRGQDLSGLKGFGKLCAGVGMTGLSVAAGNAAKDAIVKRIDDGCDMLDTAADIISTPEVLDAYDNVVDAVLNSGKDEEIEVVVS